MNVPFYQSVYNAPVLFFFAVLLVPLFYTIYQRTLHPLASVPGPFWASLSRLWMVKTARDGAMNLTMIELHARNGSLVRTGPNEVSISDLSAIKQIYGAGTRFRKSLWYSVWQGHRVFGECTTLTSRSMKRTYHYAARQIFSLNVTKRYMLVSGG